MSLSVMLMVAASFGIAVLPAYASIGLLAPVMLVVLRLVQGFALGPELGRRRRRWLLPARTG